MLAVDREARDLGLGTRLKLYQRELLLPLGVEEVRWTFDPLEARNAHLNLNHLGAEVAEYVEDMYAGEMGSELRRGIGTDRFILSWQIAGERVERGSRPTGAAGAEEPFREAPVVNPESADAGAPRGPARADRDPGEHPGPRRRSSRRRRRPGATSTRRAFETLPGARLPGRGLLSRRRRALLLPDGTWKRD